jgi:hypothetical protein
MDSSSSIKLQSIRFEETCSQDKLKAKAEIKI